MNRAETRAYYQQSHAARRMALFIIALSSFIVPLALTGAVVAIPAIADELQASAILIGWIPTVYVLGNIVALIPAGRLADCYGRKRIFILGSLLFAIATLFSGLAQSIEQLLVYRTAQGIASGMIFSTALAMISSIFRGHGSGAALGSTVSAIYLGMALGPVLGGWVTEHYGWQAFFLFQVPPALLLTGMVAIWLKGEWRSDEPLPVDWVGTVLLGSWTALIFLGIAELPAWQGIAILLLAVLVIALFIRHQQLTRTPLVNFQMVWHNRLFSRSIAAAMCMYSGNYILIFLLSLYLQLNRGLSPADAGQIIVFQALTMAVVAPFAGRLSDRYPPQILATMGSLIVAVCFIGLAFLSEMTDLSLIIVNLLVMGLGVGLFSTPNSNAALNAVPEERLAIGSALLNLARLMGNMTGMVLASILLALLIGKARIEPQQYPALLQVVGWAMGISAGFAALGAWLSLQNLRAGNTEQN